MMGKFQFEDHRDSIINLNMCQPPHTVVISANYWGWIIHEGSEILHTTEPHPDSLKNKHILKNVMMVSKRA
jgi:hypothetical protein